MLKFTHDISRGQVSLKFNEKPDARIRGMLKANGFRWAPGAGVWWRQRVSGAGDFITALHKAIEPGKPDGACWTCGEPGVFRNYGAATPVYCDACEKIHREHEADPQRYRCHDDPMGVDRLYEDQCRDICGE